MHECKFVNLKTRKTVRAESVKEFCRKVGMNDYRDVIHMYPILRGERLHHQGWTLPQYLNTHLKLKDIYGNEYEGSIAHLIYKQKIPSHRLWNLMIGKKKVFQGLFLASTQHDFVPPTLYKVVKYFINTPNQRVVSGNTMTAISRQLPICSHSVSKLAKGYSASTKGYSLNQVLLRKKTALEEHPIVPLIRIRTATRRNPESTKVKYVRPKS